MSSLVFCFLFEASILPFDDDEDDDELLEEAVAAAGGLDDEEADEEEVEEAAVPLSPIFCVSSLARLTEASAPPAAFLGAVLSTEPVEKGSLM